MSSTVYKPSSGLKWNEFETLISMNIASAYFKKDFFIPLLSSPARVIEAHEGQS